MSLTGGSQLQRAPAHILQISSSITTLTLWAQDPSGAEGSLLELPTSAY